MLLAMLAWGALLYARFFAAFVATGRVAQPVAETLRFAFKARQKADYEAFTACDEATALDFVRDAEAFVEAIERAGVGDLTPHRRGRASRRRSGCRTAASNASSRAASERGDPACALQTRMARELQRVLSRSVITRAGVCYRVSCMGLLTPHVPIRNLRAARQHVTLCRRTAA